MIPLFFVLAVGILALFIWLLITRIHHFSVIQAICPKKKIVSYLVSGLIVLAVGAVLSLSINFPSAVVCLLHLLVFWLVTDLIFMIIKKIRGKSTKYYIAGVIAIVFTLIYMGNAWRLANTVEQTNYKIATQKGLGGESLRVVQISDSHLGATFDGEGFAAHLKNIQKTKPDILVITGDFVDDDSTKVDMVRSCEALGEFQSTYGTYFVFGNHDKGYFNSRDFTEKELRDNLTKNHVTIMEDDVTIIDDRFCLVGRQDKSMAGRMTMDRLAKDMPKDKFCLVLDHQPNDYKAEQKAGADLVLSGHTHGGQLIPIGPIGELIGANDATYGLYKIRNTKFIVNSGISDWAIPFKTGTIAEYGVIDIQED